MSRRYDEVSGQLRRAYDGAVDRRARTPIEPWKHAQRSAFLEVLRGEERRTLLEIGAGTGDHSEFFSDAGIEVVCTDLSGAMVETAAHEVSLRTSRTSFTSISAERSMASLP